MEAIRKSAAIAAEEAAAVELIDFCPNGDVARDARWEE
jgi:hypothetical protein